MAAHSSILAWRIPWTEEPGGLQPMGSQGLDIIKLQTKSNGLRKRRSEEEACLKFSQAEGKLGHHRQQSYDERSFDIEIIFPQSNY